MSDLLPAVLLNALRQYCFDASLLLKMADGKDHVKIEVTFRKATNQRFDKKGAESRRRPTTPAGEWPRQPTPARRPTTTTRPTPARRPTPCVEKEAPPPLTHTLPDTTRTTITHSRTQKTAIIASTNHRSTTNTASYSRQPAEEDDVYAVTNNTSQQGEVPYKLHQIRLLIPIT